MRGCGRVRGMGDMDGQGRSDMRYCGHSGDDP